jgi:hypothetical protein
LTSCHYYLLKNHWFANQQFSKIQLAAGSWSFSKVG